MGLRASILTCGLVALGCGEQTHEGLEDAPATLAKLDVKLQVELSAGLTRDVLVELDEQAAASDDRDAGSSKVVAASSNLEFDIGGLPLNEAEPMRTQM